MYFTQMTDRHDVQHLQEYLAHSSMCRAKILIQSAIPMVESCL